MTIENLILYIIVFLYGITIGSFLNVCIYRIPKKESVVTVGSHCMNCNHKLKWYDLFPLFSWIFLRGKCRYCGTKISIQYPLVELLNGVLYVIVFAVCGWNPDSVLWCVLMSSLLVISVIDFRTMLIPGAFDAVIAVVGVVHIVLHWENWLYYVLGFACIGVFLLLLAVLFKKITGKSGLGYGDIELMACAGLCIGWGHGLLALIVGSLLSSLVEGIRVAVTKGNSKFALGPYLAVGIAVAVLFGDIWIDWYLQLL